MVFAFARADADAVFDCAAIARISGDVMPHFSWSAVVHVGAISLYRCTPPVVDSRFAQDI